MEATQLPIKERVDKQMWDINIVNRYSASKKKEILTHATTWVNLEDILLREISQSQKDKCRL